MSTTILGLVPRSRLDISVMYTGIAVGVCESTRQILFMLEELFTYVVL